MSLRSCAAAALSLLAAATSVQAHELCDGMALHTVGVSHHFQPPPSKRHTWNDWHPGLAIECRVDEKDGARRFIVGMMKDSLSSWSS